MMADAGILHLTLVLLLFCHSRSIVSGQGVFEENFRTENRIVNLDTRMRVLMKKAPTGYTEKTNFLEDAKLECEKEGARLPSYTDLHEPGFYSFLREKKFQSYKRRRNRMSDQKDRVAPDGGYGWVVAFSAMAINMIQDGIIMSSGIFFIEFTQHFPEESKTKIAWIGSTSAGMCLCIGPIANNLSSRFGCRTVAISGSVMATIAFLVAFSASNINFVILTFGIIGGTGFGLMHLPSVVMVSKYFTKKRAVATGILMCGAGIGQLVFPPVFVWLIEKYSWRGACLMAAGFSFQGAVFCSLLRELNVPNKANADDFKDDTSILSRFRMIFDLSILKKPSFIIFGCCCFFYMFGNFVPAAFLPKVAQSLGYSHQQQALCISTIGITNIIGRLIVGFIIDRPWANSVVINSVGLTIGGVSVVLMPFSTHYGILLLVCILFGCSMSAFMVTRSIIIVELHGLEKLSSAFGVVTLFQGVGSLLGTPATGALWDSTGDYKSTFAVAGEVIFLSGILCMPIRQIAKWEKEP